MSKTLMSREELVARLEASSIPEPNSGCLLWLGSVSKGYGYIHVNGKMKIASRVSYQVHCGDVGSNDVCHTCDNTYCIEPNHLFLGKALDNMKDREKKGRTWKKLTNQEIPIIRSSRAKGCDLANQYGVSQSLISKIRNNKWRANQ